MLIGVLLVLHGIRGRPTSGAAAPVPLLWAGGVAWMSMVITAGQATLPVYYLLVVVWALAACVWLSILWGALTLAAERGLLRRAQLRPLRLGLVGLTLFVAALSAQNPLDTTNPGTRSRLEVAKQLHGATDHLVASGPVTVTISGGSAFGAYGAGVVNDLVGRGYDVQIREAFANHISAYGDFRAPVKGERRIQIYVLSGSTLQRPSLPGVRLIADLGNALNRDRVGLYLGPVAPNP